MSDSEYNFDVNKQIKCQKVKYHRECWIPAFCQKIWALKKLCVTKVAHCISDAQKNVEYRTYRYHLWLDSLVKQ